GSGGGKGHGKEAHDDLSAAILWTEQHEFANEMLTVVANPGGRAVSLDDGEADTRGGRGRRSRSVSVSLLMLAAEIQYRIRDLQAYAYRYVEPERVLESIAYQEMSTYAAGVGAAELMGRGRQDFSRVMRERLQRRCDEELQLGVEIAFVALQDAHPPSDSEVAATYQRVIAAEIEKAATIEKAMGDADRMLTLTAGDVRRARELDAAILRRQELMADATPSGTREAQAAADEAALVVESLLLGDSSKGIQPPSGDVSTMIAGARAERSAAISESELKVQNFRNDLVAYLAAPDLFRVRKYLEMLQRHLPGKRKFVVVGEGGADSLTIEYETKKRTTLDLDTAALE
ncbi:MAG: hypothetical protein HOP29_20055, partial [Phycisphaerales bacterium]|nr:hypothetical protein [Phycisphaerales bacterium]